MTNRAKHTPVFFTLVTEWRHAHETSGAKPLSFRREHKRLALSHNAARRAERAHNKQRSAEGLAAEGWRARIVECTQDAPEYVSPAKEWASFAAGLVAEVHGND